ncbi:patatin-like phospholipase family protein [Caulobacter sp. DWR2-3-1b2]|uniref:patatin-like phospholipase family protein n=1 Tax=unclassified Caulobacter TaxID=2648921 RepID=UPI003CE79506
MPIGPFKKKPSGPKPISLALQGGGSHGAFEWGVIDRLLEEEDIEIHAVTAASAGAMNAVCLAQGLIDGGRANGREAAKTRLERFWKQVNRNGGRNVFGDTSIWTNAFSGGTDWLKNTPGWRMAETFALSMSPYEFNPFNLNPLHDALEGEIDFKALRERSPIKLYIAATAVRTSKLKVFRETELTARHIMASACLPQVFQAVEIDGEPYWDGGFLANPPLWPLFYDDTPDDILLVSLNPFVRDETPKTPGEIMDRLNEITFNAALASELRAIGFVQKLLDEGLLKDTARGRYRRMLMHAITADKALADLSLGSKFDTEWSFLTDLRDRGRKAADAWLGNHLTKVGVSSSLDLKNGFP